MSDETDDNVTPDWQEIDMPMPEAWGFFLDTMKTKYEVAHLHATIDRQRLRATLTVAVKPVSREMWKDSERLQHGWIYEWNVYFVPSNWHAIRLLNGAGRSAEEAKRLAYNVALGAFEGMRKNPTPALDATKLEVMKGEVKRHRHDKSMIRYVLEEESNLPKSVVDRIKLWLKSHLA